MEIIPCVLYDITLCPKVQYFSHKLTKKGLTVQYYCSIVTVSCKTQDVLFTHKCLVRHRKEDANEQGATQERDGSSWRHE